MREGGLRLFGKVIEDLIPSPPLSFYRELSGSTRHNVVLVVVLLLLGTSHDSFGLLKCPESLLVSKGCSF